MSISSIDNIIDRIKVATRKSPIAVFKVESVLGVVRFDAVFGATIDAKQRVNEDVGYIGSYYGTMDMKRVRETLMEVE